MKKSGNARTEHMSFIKSIAASINATGRLKEAYRRRIWFVGWVSVILGCGTQVLVMYQSRIALGLPLGEASLDGRRLIFLIWVLGCIVSVPFVFSLCFVFARGVFALIMWFRGQYQWQDVKGYLCNGRYPAHWLKKDV